MTTTIVGITGIVLASVGFLIAARGMDITKPNPTVERCGYWIFGIGIVIVFLVVACTNAH